MLYFDHVMDLEHFALRLAGPSANKIFIDKQLVYWAMAPWPENYGR